MDVTSWLLEGDPAIRWQVLRDLTDASPDDVAVERARVEHEGWGARLLAAEDPDGLWAGGACFPASYEGGEPGQPWTPTMHTLQTLQLLGLDPQSESARRTTALVAENGRWEHDGQRYFDGEVEPCINGRTIETGAYLGVDVAPLVERIVDERLQDGGWNCEAENGSVRTSFDTTINVLDGLREFERATGGSAEVREARRTGEEYLLERSLLRRKSTGEVVDPAYLEFAFPYYWHYDVLRALDYFRERGAEPDPRMAEAVEVVRSKRQPDGRWLLDRIHPGRVHFDIEGGGCAEPLEHAACAPGPRLVGRYHLAVTASLLAVIVDCRDARKQAEFWAAALSQAVTERNPDEFEVYDEAADRSATPLYFMKVPEPKTEKNRLHLDLVTEGSMETEVERLVALGARLVEARQDPTTHDNPDTWTVMEDPEGNVFCVSSTRTITGWV